jgi:RNA polymerase sigma factor (sigma-70 family)
LDTLEKAVDRVLSGDRAAFQQIVDATSQKLVRLGARIMGNQADAEDVVQEAYVKAFRALTGGEFDRRSSTSTWLYRIVVNGAIDAKRSRTRRAESSDEQVDPKHASASPSSTSGSPRCPPISARPSCCRPWRG